MIKIEKNVKMPIFREGRNLYPWKEMKVGDSFVSDRIMHGAGFNASIKHAPKKFIARKEGDHYRVWRIR